MFRSSILGTNSEKSGLHMASIRSIEAREALNDANPNTKGGELVSGNKFTGDIPNAGLQIPGQLLNEDDKSALKIKIHLNIQKVRLDLDAQIYCDAVVGLM
ncbi:hypothetical protein N7520_009016 [Penicillium odoratum]|uniref:uncharacterized protein n=1 Tax=Penicillium odoratum TaxID=1167516 RepID=UPI0025468F2F|nr:uncharacterized protein N7520_009016 [Penicillium odoratum]KAJ5752099.1 hypothetical protein N7520_009016 [Penicillium odoratum]